MNEEMEGDGTGNRSGDYERRRAERPLAVVQPGDRVVHTTDLGKEYEYTVAGVDPPWITFETGQQVHRDRFERENFAVFSPTEVDAFEAVTVEAGDADGRDGEVGEAATPATDGGDVRTPNDD